MGQRFGGAETALEPWPEFSLASPYPCLGALELCDKLYVIGGAN